MSSSDWKNAFADIVTWYEGNPRLHLFRLKGGTAMESTHEYVEKLRENAKKAEHNRKRGKGTPSASLPTKQHTNNP